MAGTHRPLRAIYLCVRWESGSSASKAGAAMTTKEPTLPGLAGAETARILLASDIRNLVRSHAMLAPFDESNVASCTYDLTAGSKGLLVGVDQATEHPIRPDHSLRLEPGAYAGIISR